jgi:hypothetical protein
MTSIHDELELLRAADPVSISDLPAAPEGLYGRITGRRRRTSGIVVAAATACVIAVAGAVLPARLGDQSRLRVVERALAAVSDGPVIHGIVENMQSRAYLVDLASGEEVVEAERHEYWYDAKRGALNARLTVGDAVLNEISLARSFGPPPSHRALAFATHYREALEGGRARVVRWETLDGTRSPVLSIDVPAWRNPRTGQVLQPGYTEEVVVDGKSYKPLRFRHLPGPDVVAGPVYWWRVVTIETADRIDEGYLRRAEPRRWKRFAPSQDTKVTAEEAGTALGRPALWAGTELDGAPLTRIGVVTSTITWLDGRETKTPSLFIRYEDPSAKRSLWMTVALSRDFSGHWGPVDGAAVPPGKVRLKQGDRGLWFGNVERGGLYVNLQSPERQLVLAAAKALKPLG